MLYFEWPVLVCIKSTSAKIIFVSAKEGNRNSYLKQADIDNIGLKLC